MAFWKQKYNQTEGFSLIEVMVSIAILGFVAVPMFTGLLFSYQLNKRSDEKLQAQLAVSSAVETIMAEGFDKEKDYTTDFSSVKVKYDNDFSGPAVKFTVSSEEFPDIAVETYARPYPEGGDHSD